MLKSILRNADWSALGLDFSALLGAAAIAHGIWNIYPPAGEIAAGVFILGAAVLKTVAASK